MDGWLDGMPLLTHTSGVCCSPDWTVLLGTLSTVAVVVVVDLDAVMLHQLHQLRL